MASLGCGFSAVQRWGADRNLEEGLSFERLSLRLSHPFLTASSSRSESSSGNI